MQALYIPLKDFLLQAYELIPILITPAIRSLFLGPVTNGELPRVENLRESDVYPTAWTRLNVKPAKIMQVN